MLAVGIETVERIANQLSGLIKDLLDLTRIISRKIELARCPTNLGELIQAVVTQVQSEATMLIPFEFGKWLQTCSTMR